MCKLTTKTSSTVSLRTYWGKNMIPTQIRAARPSAALPRHPRVTSKGQRAASASPALADDNYCVDRRSPFRLSLLTFRLTVTHALVYR